MKPRVLVACLGCFLTLFLLPGLGLAEKGGKNSAPGTGDLLDARADFATVCPDGMGSWVDCTLLPDIYGPYVSGGKDSIIFSDSGSFHMLVGANKNSLRHVLFDLSTSLGNADSVCSDGATVPQLPTDEIGNPLTALEGQPFDLYLWREFIYCEEHQNWEWVYKDVPEEDRPPECRSNSYPCFLNVRDMEAGNSTFANAELSFRFGEGSLFDLHFYGDADDGVLQITAGQTNTGSQGDTWVIRPVEGNPIYPVNQARLIETVLGRGGKILYKCDHGDFFMPFMLTITRVD